MADRPPCHLQDYLEIACMFGYRIRLTLFDGTELTGIAIDVYSQHGNEYFSVKAEERINIPTSNLKHLTVLTQGARFKDVAF